jgi:hypothetical protein
LIEILFFDKKNGKTIGSVVVILALPLPIQQQQKLDSVTGFGVKLKIEKRRKKTIDNKLQ